MPTEKKTLLDKWKWVGRILSDSQLSGTAKSSAYYLAEYHRNVTGLAYPSCKTLAKRSGVSVRAAQEAVRLLRTRGWIILVERNHGPGQSNRYAINWENTIEPSQIRRHKKKGANKENTNSSAQNTNDLSALNTNEPSDNSFYSFHLENPLNHEASSETNPRYDSHDPTGSKDIEILKPAKANKLIGLKSGTAKVDDNEAGNSLDRSQQSQEHRYQEELERLKQWELEKEEARRLGVEFSEYLHFKEAHDKADEVATPMMLYRISEEAQREHNDSAGQIRYMIERYEAILSTPSSKNDRNESNDKTDQGAGEKHLKPTPPSKSKD